MNVTAKTTLRPRVRRLRLGRRDNGRLLTAREFDRATGDRNYRYELVHGVVIVSPIPGNFEVDPNEELGRLLRNYQAAHPHGKHLDYTAPERYVHLGPEDRRKADRLLWIGLGRLPDETQDVASIAVEFVSAAKRDRDRDYIEKREEYERLGIREYWIIDRFRRTLTVHRPGLAPLVVPEAENYRTPLLPGFELPLGSLLALADRWKR